jgi:O-Antigen ligase
LNVYLPCLIFLPDYYSFRVPHLPPESAASWSLLPLGLSLLFYPIPQLQLRRLDLWITLYTLSYAASELLREPNPKDGLVVVSAFIFQTLFAYIVGRRVIEPNLRVATLQRIMLLTICLAPFILYEYVKRNPWVMMASHFHLEIPLSIQGRNGHARVQASFVHAIIAGIMFFIVLLLNSYLADLYKRDRSRLGPIARRLERYHAPALLILMFLWLTQSRGPMLSAVVGYSVLQIPRFRHLKIAGFAIALLLTIGGFAAYSYYDKYTSATDDGTLSEQQTSAIYRRELMKNYQPVVEKGGWLGWGAFAIPEAGGQRSIDNAYLIVELGQGKLGFYLFLLIIAEALVSTAYHAFSFASRESRLFAFTLFAAMTGLFLCLTAVYLGPAAAPTCFLLLGWSQSVQDDASSEPRFNFKRLFV